MEEEKEICETKLEKLRDIQTEHWLEYADAMIADTIKTLNDWLEACREGEIGYREFVQMLKEVAKDLEMQLF